MSDKFIEYFVFDSCIEINFITCIDLSRKITVILIKLIKNYAYTVKLCYNEVRLNKFHV